MPVAPLQMRRLRLALSRFKKAHLNVRYGREQTFTSGLRISGYERPVAAISGHSIELSLSISANQISTIRLSFGETNVQKRCHFHLFQLGLLCPIFLLAAVS